jgi:hypothetical protein
MCLVEITADGRHLREAVARACDELCSRVDKAQDPRHALWADAELGAHEFAQMAASEARIGREGANPSRTAGGREATPHGLYRDREAVLTPPALEHHVERDGLLARVRCLEDAFGELVGASADEIFETEHTKGERARAHSEECPCAERCQLELHAFLGTVMNDVDGARR